MNKKKYQKPHMVVYPLVKANPLLSQSDAINYIPRINDDLNKLT